MTAPRLRRMIAVRLVTQQPDRLARFYSDALGANPSPATPLTGEERALLGPGRRSVLTVGAQRLDLESFDALGAPYPDDIGADDPRFQHCAFVVGDIVAVHAHALRCAATEISRGGPVALPASAGGVTAVKLRDPEGHPFELLAFPPGSHPLWDRAAANERGVLGIDHSAITVADARASTAFYARHGLSSAGAGINRGPTQAALDGLDAPVVDVVPLRPEESGSHLELLGYRGASATKATTKLRDVAATRIAWASDGEGLLVDPDGHRHQLTMA